MLITPFFGTPRGTKRNANMAKTSTRISTTFYTRRGLLGVEAVVSPSVRTVTAPSVACRREKRGGLAPSSSSCCRPRLYRNPIADRPPPPLRRRLRLPPPPASGPGSGSASRSHLLNGEGEAKSDTGRNSPILKQAFCFCKRSIFAADLGHFFHRCCKRGKMLSGKVLENYVGEESRKEGSVL